MKTKNLMSSPAVTVHPHDRLAHAAALMWQNDCGALPVVDKDGRVGAMVTDRDVCMAAWSTGKPLHELRVQDAMSKALVSVRADDDLGVAVDRMTMHQLHRLPVVDEHERPVGVLSLNDLGRRGDKDPQLGKRALQVMAAVCRLRNEAAPPAQRTMQAAAQAVAT
jgi:CBS-domain-containing membrane protein